MIGISNHHMVNHINFEQLPSSDEVTGDLNVRFGRRDSPEGWLCMIMMADALAMIASRKTSLGWQRMVSIVPTDTK